MIVHVQFKNDNTGRYAGKNSYTYETDLPLKVGDAVLVPARDSVGSAKVTAVNVPEDAVDPKLLPLLKTVIGYDEYPETLLDDEPTVLDAVPVSELPDDLITVKQVPMIVDNILALEPVIRAKGAEVLSMAVTEETRAVAKTTKANINKEREEFEKRVNNALAPIYDAVRPIEDAKKKISGVYKEIYAAMGEKVSVVEDGLKDQKREEIRAFYEEYRQSCDLGDERMADFDKWPKAKNILLGDSAKGLRETAKEYLNQISGDMTTIRNLQYPDEILIEYRVLKNCNLAIQTVFDRHRKQDEERQRREAAAAEREEREAREKENMAKVEAAIAASKPLEPPKPAEPEKPQKDPNQILTLRFTVTATRAKLIELRNFLKDGGYQYE